MAISAKNVANFETLKDAIKNDRACLLECTDVKTQQPVVALCRVERTDDGTYEFTPLAELFDGDAREELVPPL